MMTGRTRRSAMRLAFVVPQGIEALAVAAGVRRASPRPVVVRTAIGSTDVARTLRHLRALAATHAVCAGLCGFLRPGLRAGEPVIYDACVDVAGEATAPDAALTAFLRLHLRARAVRGLTVDRIVVRAAEKAALAERYDASAVDMETAPLIRALQAAGVACAAVRVGSDGAAGDLPDLAACVRPDGALDARKVATAMLDDPRAAGRLVGGSLRGLRTLVQTAELAACALNAELE